MLRYRFNIFQFSLVSIFSGLHRFINFGSSLCRTSPEHFRHQIKSSKFRSTLLTMPCAPKCGLLHLPSLCSESSRNHFGPSHDPCIFVFFAASSAPHTPICACRRTPHRSMLLCFALCFFFFKKKKCLETVASWQHCIDYITTSARLSVPVRNLCRGKGLGRNASPSHKKPYQLRNFNDSNTSQLSHRNHTCTSLPSQPSPYCCSPSLM